MVQSHPDVITQRLGDDVILLHLETDRFYQLNHTAARFWELLSTGKDLREIQDQMLQEFHVDAEQLMHEITSLITSLKEENLVIVH